MPFSNTKKEFGSLTKLLHWLIFILFVLQFFLVYRREYFPKGSPEKLQFILLHKSIGVCLLILAIFMILWRQVGTRPNPVLNMGPFGYFASMINHFLLYLTMLWMPISGLLMSMYSGKAVSFFGWFTIPNPLTKNESLASFFYTSHVWCSYLVIALVSLHTLGALYHHFYKRDRVLVRMMPFSS